MLFLALSALGAWSDIKFYIEPTLQKGFGGTSYDLSFDAGGGWTGLSRLEFPEVSLELGVVVGLLGQQGDRTDWLVEAAGRFSTLPMGGTMYDYDWFQQAGYPKVPFSYTYSSDSTVSLDVSIAAAWTFASGAQWSLGLLGLYRYQDFSHVEDSVTGWQYVWNGAAYDLNTIVDYTTDVLEYRLISHSFGLGVLGELRPATDLQLELRTCFTPVFAADLDDHVLRTKRSTASGDAPWVWLLTLPWMPSSSTTS